MASPIVDTEDRCAMLSPVRSFLEMEDAAMNLVMKRRWLWGPMLWIFLLTVALVVCLLAALTHLFFFGYPAEYYIRAHGDVATARSVSFAAVIVLVVLALGVLSLIVQTRTWLFVRYRFVWALAYRLGKAF